MTKRVEWNDEMIQDHPSMTDQLVASKDAVINVNADMALLWFNPDRIGNLSNAHWTELIDIINAYINKHVEKRGQHEIAEAVKQMLPPEERDQVLINDRSILNGKELDIVIPTRKIAIEFNGLTFHDETYHDKDHHKNKREDANKNGYTLINVWSDDWNDSPQAILNYINTQINRQTMRMVRLKGKEIRSFMDSYYPSKYNDHISDQYHNFGWLDANDALRCAISYKITENGVCDIMRYIDRDMSEHRLIETINSITARNPHIQKFTISINQDFGGQEELFQKAGFTPSDISKPKRQYVDKSIDGWNQIRRSKKTSMKKPKRIWNSGFITLVLKVKR